MRNELRVRIDGNADEFGSASVEVWEIPFVKTEAFASEAHLIEVEVGNLLLANQFSVGCYAERLAAYIRRPTFGATCKQSKSNYTSPHHL